MRNILGLVSLVSFFSLSRPLGVYARYRSAQSLMTGARPSGPGSFGGGIFLISFFFWLSPSGPTATVIDERASPVQI